MVAIVLLWNRAIGPLELSLLVGFYVITALGVTLGYHRMFTHRAFESSRAFRAIVAVIGSMAVQGSVITWVADHRKHHAFTDQDGDPHSPAPQRPGLRRRRSRACGTPTSAGCSRPSARPSASASPPTWSRTAWSAPSTSCSGSGSCSGLAIPFALGWIVGGGIGTALTALLWGGFVRVFLLHHVTWSINSVCHFFGRKRFDVEDESRNVFWLAPLSMGEAWHHNHHAFPTSAFHGLRFWERMADPTGLVIALLERLGIVWNVVRVSPERQAAKTLPSAQRGSPRRRSSAA